MLYLPWALTGFQLQEPLLGTSLTRVAGGLLLVAAIPLFLEFLWRFVEEGHGTPAPLAPTERLVVGGTFRRVRNPGYVAVATFRRVRNPGYVAVAGILLGEALLLGSGVLLAYAAGIWLLFHCFVLLYEEPTLRRQFGEEYEAYCRNVPRWLPRLEKGDGP
ncbi:MAG: isoprenylcysteine carboxylmethyltransferase family protein [Deltaproteobacteria bacterium]|nr:isoprenylcysteine carboxylmethyltransferase family protein [Deltaproteobacteria bacterium]